MIAALVAPSVIMARTLSDLQQVPQEAAMPGYTDMGYIQSELRPGTRAWGPEQATGKPDTLMAGDIVTAWASATPDEQDEWLLLTYAKAVKPVEIQVYETYNPGAVYRVTVFDGNKEVEVWSGTDPVTVNSSLNGLSSMGTAKLPVTVGFSTKMVKVYLHSKAVTGWNEIDAVGIRDVAGTVHWAKKARASSTFAAPAYSTTETSPVYVDPYMERMDKLEARIKQLEDQVQELRTKLKMN